MRLICNETQLQHLARALSCILQRGDVIALHGDLGAGKTTFSRYLICAIMGHDEEIPSPTFPLVQTYDTARFPVAHFDLYRLGGPDELIELGFDDAAADGLVLIEWPGRAGDYLPADRLDLHLRETDDPTKRLVELRGLGDWALRVPRFAARQAFLKANGWDEARFDYMQGDGSSRAYMRLHGAQGRAVLMDAPAMSDGPILKDGKSYSKLAHLAEDVRPFVAVAKALRDGGIRTPEILAADLELGFLVLEDLGDKVFAAQLQAGVPQRDLWRRAVDVLVALVQVPAPSVLSLPGGQVHKLPRFDSQAMQIEVELLLDWYWPYAHGQDCPDEIRQEFLALWQPVFTRLQAGGDHWILRDYHSPNLLCLAGDEPGGEAGIESGDAAAAVVAQAPRDIGVIDFQDAMRGAASYDLVSLLQDARIDVAAPLEQALYAHYCSQVRGVAPHFDADEFAFSYAAFGLQRATKVLGIFVRLAQRDGKPQYLARLPAIWDYAARNLAHADLAPLKLWYDKAVPPASTGSPAKLVAAASVAPATASASDSGTSPSPAPASLAAPAPQAAMILGAGLGTRMRPLTEHMPKPMVALAGRPLIDHVLARLHSVGVAEAVVNVHYCADVLERHLRDYHAPQIHISDERDEILDTGGGVAKALAGYGDILGRAPFWIHNSDSVWIELGDVARGDDENSAAGAAVTDGDTLAQMARAWDADQMDCLLMLAPVATAIGYDGRGDFNLGADARLTRRAPDSAAPFVFAGVSIMHPHLFDSAPSNAFSLNLLWNKAMQSKRLFGFCANSIWMHVGDPTSLQLAERQLRNGRKSSEPEE